MNGDKHEENGKKKPGPHRTAFLIGEGIPLRITPRRTRRFTLSAFLLLLAGCHNRQTLVLDLPHPGEPITLTADGRTHRVGVVHLRHGDLQANEITLTGGPGALEDASGKLTVWLRSPVSQRTSRITLTAPGASTTVRLDFRPDDQPSAQHPGFPDWMPLHTSEDRDAFRRWFTEVAERTADLPPDQLPREISDCSALLRYSFREALREHDDKWYAQLGPQEMPTLRSVAQWTYPNTPMASGLFRTRPGTFSPTDLQDNTFAQFADAKTLVAENTHLVSRSLDRARPGDLLFYRLLEGTSQYHSMIVTGDHAQWVVYHTGPTTTPHGKTKGEMRRVLLNDLLHHPDTRWHPLPTNANFLGVYRWDILDDNS